jgi:hypothetical protein
MAVRVLFFESARQSKVNLEPRVLLGSSSELPQGFTLRKKQTPEVYLSPVLISSLVLGREKLRAIFVASRAELSTHSFPEGGFGVGVFAESRIG